MVNNTKNRRKDKAVHEHQRQQHQDSELDPNKESHFKPSGPTSLLRIPVAAFIALFAVLLLLGFKTQLNPTVSHS